MATWAGTGGLAYIAPNPEEKRALLYEPAEFDQLVALSTPRRFERFRLAADAMLSPGREFR